MKKLIALLTALVMVLSLSACFAQQSDSTADEAKAADVSTYSKDFEGLQKYIADRNSSAVKQEIYYDILGAKDGIRFILSDRNPIPYVEVYDFSNTATADSASSTASKILAEIKKNGKFTPLEDGTEMTAVITKSGKYVIAWDDTRKSNDYTAKVATDELIENW